MDDLRWETPKKSDVVERFAYVPEYHDLVLVFKSGGFYHYGNVEEDTVKILRKAHPWSKIGAELRDTERHPCHRLATIRTRPLKGRRSK